MNYLFKKSILYSVLFTFSFTTILYPLVDLDLFGPWKIATPNPIFQQAFAADELPGRKSGGGGDPEKGLSTSVTAAWSDGTTCTEAQAKKGVCDPAELGDVEDICQTRCDEPAVKMLCSVRFSDKKEGRGVTDYAKLIQRTADFYRFQYILYKMFAGACTWSIIHDAIGAVQAIFVSIAYYPPPRNFKALVWYPWISKGVKQKITKKKGVVSKAIKGAGKKSQQFFKDYDWGHLLLKAIGVTIFGLVFLAAIGTNQGDHRDYDALSREDKEEWLAKVDKRGLGWGMAAQILIAFTLGTIFTGFIKTDEFYKFGSGPKSHAWKTASEAPWTANMLAGAYGYSGLFCPMSTLLDDVWNLFTGKGFMDKIVGLGSTALANTGGPIFTKLLMKLGDENCNPEDKDAKGGAAWTPQMILFMYFLMNMIGLLLNPNIKGMNPIFVMPGPAIGGYFLQMIGSVLGAILYKHAYPKTIKKEYIKTLDQVCELYGNKAVSVANQVGAFGDKEKKEEFLANFGESGECTTVCKQQVCKDYLKPNADGSPSLIMAALNPEDPSNPTIIPPIARPNIANTVPTIPTSAPTDTGLLDTSFYTNTFKGADSTSDPGYIKSWEAARSRLKKDLTKTSMDNSVGQKDLVDKMLTLTPEGLSKLDEAGAKSLAKDMLGPFGLVDKDGNVNMDKLNVDLEGYDPTGASSVNDLYAMNKALIEKNKGSLGAFLGMDINTDRLVSFEKDASAEREVASAKGKGFKGMFGSFGKKKKKKEKEKFVSIKIGAGKEKLKRELSSKLKKIEEGKGMDVHLHDRSASLFEIIHEHYFGNYFFFTELSHKNREKDVEKAAKTKPKKK